MSESKPRPIAGDVGTDHLIECDDGHYWVRLVTKAAILREGAAMRNCLQDGSYEDAAGPESFYDHSLWSLRDRAGASIALCVTLGRADCADLGQFYGPSNNTPSALAYRQLRYLAGAFERAGHPLGLRRNRDEPVVIAPDGSTYRWDRAPKALRLSDHETRLEARRRAHEEAKKRREAAERVRENQPPIPVDTPFRGITANMLALDEVDQDDFIEIRSNEVPGNPAVVRLQCRDLAHAYRNDAQARVSLNRVVRGPVGAW